MRYRTIVEAQSFLWRLEVSADDIGEIIHVDDDASILTQVFADGFIGVVVDDDTKFKGVVTKLDLVDFLTSSVETPA